MGTGKSSISKHLSEKTGLKQISLDKKIEEINSKTISEIFACFDEEYFRKSETETLLKVCKEPPAIVDCGGGLPTISVNRDIIRKNGTTIWFKASPTTIYERIKYDKSRPLLAGNMSVEYITEILQKRENAYSVVADIIIETDNKTIEEICSEVLSKLSTLI